MTPLIRLIGCLIASLVLTYPCLAADSDAKNLLQDSIAANLSGEHADPGGVRAALSARGIEYGLTYYGELFRTVSGGIERKAHFHGLVDVQTNIDFEKLAGWNGLSFHANVYRPHGTSITLESTGTIAAVSHIEATPLLKLFEGWFEQSFSDGKVTLRFGQLAADAEFATLDSSASLISSTFGWNTLMTDNLPNGGPIYPLATPGVRLQIQPYENWNVLAAIYNGDPVGPCDGDPQRCNKHCVDFRISDPPLVMTEIAHDYDIGLPGTFKLGGWYNFKSFDDQRLDAMGVPLASPASSGAPLQHDGNYGIYGVIYQMLYRVSESSDKGIHLFSRVAASPPDRNQIDFYAEAGFTFSGLSAVRPDDVLAIGVAYTRISDDAAAFDRDLENLSGVLIPTRDFELLFEMSYTFQLAAGWKIQPDFQYYWHPGGHVASARATDAQANVAAVGLRSVVHY